MPLAGDPPEGIVAYRLGQIEQRMDRIEAGVNSRLDSIQGSIGSLAFVRKDVYDADQKRVEDRVAAAETTADRSHGLAMWSLGVTLTFMTLVGALVVALRAFTG